LTEGLIDSEEIEDDLLDEILGESAEADAGNAPHTIDRQKLREEIEILQRLADWARSIGTDTKTRTLLTALDIGFAQMAATGAARKALIFTESRRTQEYLKTFLESNGYRGQVVLFNGTNGGPEATRHLRELGREEPDSGRASGFARRGCAHCAHRALPRRRHDPARHRSRAEGINLQFCSLVINYDLPWNPQRIEQRIGRCHRYGQSTTWWSSTS
jgi:superfamily II DNA/RNA helicase